MRRGPGASRRGARASSWPGLLSPMRAGRNGRVMLGAMIHELVGHSRRLLLASLVLGALGAFLGCGDSGSKQNAKSPKGSSSSKTDDKGPSIGDLAASQ